MKLCIDCTHFRRVQMLDSKGVCRHPDSVILRSPIDGEVTYNTAENMRKGFCKFDGRLHEAIIPVSPKARIKRWFNISSKG